MQKAHNVSGVFTEPEIVFKGHILWKEMVMIVTEALLTGLIYSAALMQDVLNKMY